jgi:hypothetical protein
LSQGWKTFPNDYLEKRLDLLPVDLFETGVKDKDEGKQERLADYPDYPDDEDESD